MARTKHVTPLDGPEKQGLSQPAEERPCQPCRSRGRSVAELVGAVARGRRRAWQGVQQRTGGRADLASPLPKLVPPDRRKHREYLLFRAE
jgi:hypothetical protein